MSSLAQSTSRRLVSLDALRGFDMFWILGGDALVQALGAFSHAAPVRLIAAQLDHKAWAGFAFYDLIFPLFVFIVGVSIVLSLSHRLEETTKGALVTKILRRGFWLFVLGVVSNGGLTNQWPDVRIAGVLPRIALAYTAVAWLFLFFRTRTLVVIAVALLVGYWALLTFVPVRDFQLDEASFATRLGTSQPTQAQIETAFAATTNRVTGHFEPGLNLTNHLDFQYLPGRMYDRYYDPEGLLSTLPAIASCLLGVFAGRLLMSRTVVPRAKLGWFVAGGVTLLVAGWCWHLQFPVVKKLWTSSFVLVAGGWSVLLLALFYYVVDVRQWRRWCQPFVWIGMNPITLYLAVALVGFHEIAARLVGGSIKVWLDAHIAVGAGGLMVTTVALGLIILLARFLHRHQIFLRV